MTQGTSRGPTLSDVLGERKGTPGGHGQGHGEGNGTGEGNGDGSGQGEGQGKGGQGSFEPGALSRQSPSGQKTSPQSFGRAPSGEGEGEFNPEEDDFDSEQTKTKLQNLAQMGKNAAEKLGGGGDTSKSSAPSKKTEPLKVPKPKLKRFLLLMAFLFTVAGIAFYLFKDKKKERAKSAPQPKPLSKNEQAALLKKLDESLKPYLDADGEMVKADDVIKTYHLFLEFLEKHEAGRPAYATPDEFTVDVAMLTRRKEMQPLTSVFCGTLYGRQNPSRQEFRAYLNNVRAVARAVHDAR